MGSQRSAKLKLAALLMCHFLQFVTAYRSCEDYWNDGFTTDDWYFMESGITAYCSLSKAYSNCDEYYLDGFVTGGWYWTEPDGWDGYLVYCPMSTVYRNCEDYSQAGFVIDGLYWIDPDGPGREDAFDVYCTMSTGLTTVFNNIPSNGGITLSGDDALFETPGEFAKMVTYEGTTSLQQLKPLIESSESCVQFLSFGCLGVNIWSDDGVQMVWWVSRDGEKMPSWGGAPSDFEGCGCALRDNWSSSSSTCFEGGRCNCDADGGGAKIDDGNIADMTKLPVKEIRIGGITSNSDRVRFRVGPLKCSGIDACPHIRYTTSSAERPVHLWEGELS